jgi:hypothetical protein
MTPAEKAKEIVQTIYESLEFNKHAHGDAMFDSTFAVGLITKALTEAQHVPRSFELHTQRGSYRLTPCNVDSKLSLNRDSSVFEINSFVVEPMGESGNDGR